MMAKFQHLDQAWQYINRVQGSRKLWTIVYFKHANIPVSNYYVFTSAPYVGNAMHGVAQNVLSYLGASITPQMTPQQEAAVKSLTRKFSDAFRDSYFNSGGQEMGGHAEEFFAICFHRFYPDIIRMHPDTAVVINSDSPCTLADQAPSRPRTIHRPNNPAQLIKLGASCTAKLNTIAAYTPEIPNWEVFYLKKFGVWTARKGNDMVLNQRDAAETQILTAQHIKVRKYGQG